MKISKLFHWLYASVLFLPLLVAPIFALAVRSDNNFQPIDVQAPQFEVVDFNQRIQNGNFENGLNNFGYNGSNVNVNSNSISWTATSQYAQFYASSTSCNLNDKYLVKITLQGLYDYTNNIRIYKGNTFSGTSFNIGAEIKTCQFIDTAVNEVSNPLYIQNNVSSDFNTYLISNFQMFNLTQMFGSGNEPTIDQFNTWYTSIYYDYTLSHKELLNVGTITYNDADVGSQLIYSLYNTVNNYFNFDSVFNFGDLYSWLNFTFFSGNAPLGFFIFWHYLIYWLLISLLWLLFDVLMYVPNLVHRWLDKAAIE